MSEPIDKDQLLDEFDDDREFLRETYEIFIEESKELLMRLNESMRAEDAQGLATAAHTIKSMVGNFFATPAHRAAFELEISAKENDFSDVSEKVETVRVELQRLKQSLGDLIEGLE